MKSFARLCVCAALASLFAPAAMADGLYLRLAAGGGHVDEDSFGGAEFDYGYVGSAAIGYNWFFPESVADLRLELEGSYRFNDLDQISGLSADGDTEAYSAMINGYFDIRNTWVIVPYVGAGFGATNVRFDSDGAGGAFATFDDNDTVFAYQVMAGFNYFIGDNMAVGLEYRFLETEDFELTNSVGGTFEDDYNHHSALVTFTLGF